MVNAFDKIKTEQKKQEQEIRNRERQDQFKGVKRAERARVCKLVRENAINIGCKECNETLYYIVPAEIINEIEGGEL